MIWLADVLALAGVVVMTIGIVGIVRLRGRLRRIQAASVVPIGTALIVAAAFVAGPSEVTARSVLVLVALLITAPLSTHELVRLTAERGDDEGGPGPR